MTVLNNCMFGTRRILHLSIEAPRSYCRDSIMKRMQVSREVADCSITQTDKYRAAYYKYYTGGEEWTNPVNYDLTLNSERVGFDNCVKLIEDYVAMKCPDFEISDKK